VFSGTNSIDTAVRAWVLAHQNETARQISVAVSEVGGVGLMRSVGIATSLFLLLRGRRRAALSVITAPCLAWAAYATARRLMPRERPPGAVAFDEVSSSFPSAHTVTSTAVCCALAYVLWREHVLAAPIAILIATLPPLIIGLSRVYLDVHWMTDVAAGWMGGLLIASIARLLYRFDTANQTG
jgi:undecaprenyl-diphosphatase